VRFLAIALFLAAGAAITTLVGVAAGARLLLPVLGAAIPFAVFYPRVRDGRLRGALGWTLLWAVFQSAALQGAMAIAPGRTGHAVIRGESYPAEMMHWVRTGEGEEGSPRLYLPIHIRHFAAFSLLSLVSAGAGGLVLGTILLNYMNAYVGTLTAASAHPAVAAAFGWPVWAVIRVVGFVATGTALASYGFSLLDRLRGRSPRRPFPTRFFLLGLGLVVADAILKAVLAPFWRGILLPGLGGGS
jgi:hypothetical protein